MKSLTFLLCSVFSLLAFLSLGSANEAKKPVEQAAEPFTAEDLQAALVASDWDYTFELYDEESLNNLSFEEGGLFAKQEIHLFSQWQVGTTLDGQVYLDLVSEDWEMMNNFVVLRFLLEEQELDKRGKATLHLQFDAKHWLQSNEPVDHAREQMEVKAQEVIDGFTPAMLTLQEQ